MVLNPFSKESREKREALKILNMEYEFFLIMYDTVGDIVNLVEKKNARVIGKLIKLSEKLSQIEKKEQFNARVSKLKGAVKNLLALPSIRVTDNDKWEIKDIFEQMGRLEARVWIITAQDLFQSVSGLSKDQRWDIPLEHAKKLKKYISALISLDRKLRDVIKGYP